MKRIKRIASLLLAMVMVLGMTLTVFATEGEEVTPPGEITESAETYKITINNTVAGHTYEAYQIFAGTLYEDETGRKTLSNIVWGIGITDDGKTELGDAAAKAKELETADAAAVAAFAQTVGEYLATTSGSATVEADEENVAYEITDLAPGYYLIKDQDNSLTGNDSYTTFILEVVGDAEATPKNSGTPEPDKSVKDKNDTEGETTDWQDSADYDIGDEIEFELKATLPGTVTAYDKYKLVFHDTLSAGLDYVADSAVVKLNGTEINSGYKVEYAETPEKKLTITFEDAKAAGATNSSVITVEYRAVLNENAVIGAAGNKNELTLEYSNNPNNTGEGEPTGTTPPVVAVVFTFETVVNKVQPGDTEGTTKPLAGAEFTLQKFVKGEDGNGTWVDCVTADITGDEKNIFSFKGLDDGWYRLTESVVPNGFNKIDDIYFKVSAVHDETAASGSTAALKSLTVVATDKDGKELTGENKTEFTVTLNNGNITTDVLNQKGSVLPSTGGIGTTIFYIVGGILVVGAGVLLVTKKRMSAR